MLLVDDDGVSLARDARIIRSAGYAVKPTPSFLHALRVLEREEVFLVVAEQEMGGMEGLALLSLVKSRWPKTRRIIATAHPRGELVIRAKKEANARTLIRPVPADKLVTVVKEELDAYRA